MDDILRRRGRVSGPWKLNVNEAADRPSVYLFYEQHDNEGSCPDEGDMSLFCNQVLEQTPDVHVFVEHFKHAESLGEPRRYPCYRKQDVALTNMRRCMETARLGGYGHRVHFVDPRCDIIHVLPNGKIFDAIASYVRNSPVEDSRVLLYEAFIHPLTALVPDMGGAGRVFGEVKGMTTLMRPRDRIVFERLWASSVVSGIKDLVLSFESSVNRDIVEVTEDLMDEYTTLTNSFLDLGLMARLLTTGYSSAVVYLGSRHSRAVQGYLLEFGYDIVRSMEGDRACLEIRV